MCDLDPKDDKSLKNIRNTKLQLDLIRAHVRNYDIGDVLNVVVPKYDVLLAPEVEDQICSLFEDCPLLNRNTVALSCAWYNIWAADDHIQQDMTYLFTFCQNNAMEGLWNKALEDYEGFNQIYQGGPLMFYLVLERMQSSSESNIRTLRTRIENLKIKDP